MCAALIPNFHSICPPFLILEPTGTAKQVLINYLGCKVHPKTRRAMAQKYQLSASTPLFLLGGSGGSGGSGGGTGIWVGHCGGGSAFGETTIVATG
jgi:hypothetical protein